MNLNKKALIWAVVMMALSYGSNLLFPGPFGPESNIFYFLGVALLGVITYQVVKRYFPGKPRTIASDATNPEASKTVSQISFSRRRLYFFAGLFTVSILYNVSLYYKTKEIPWIGSGGTSGVDWYSSDHLYFSGIPTFSNAEDDWKTGYQLWTGEIKIDYLGDQQLKCRVNQAIILNNIITMDGPFEAEERTCKILSFNGEKRIATIEIKEMTFSVLGEKATWKSKTDSGALITLSEFERRRR